MSAGAALGPVTLGLDVGGTKMLGLALDGAGATLAETRVPSPGSPSAGAGPGGTGPGVLLDALASLAEQVMTVPGAVDRARVQAVGVGVPGLVDDDGTLRFAPNLPVGNGAHIARELSTRLGLRVVVDNDANCAAIAESTLGAVVCVPDAVVVTLGTGIGGGIVSGGGLLRGTNGFAGEIGHMVVDPSGPLCPCGQRGCWECFASGSGLARLARQAARAGRLGAVVRLAGDDPEGVRGEHVTQAARAGDEEAQAVLEELGWWIALGLSNLALVLDPQVIVLGGGLVETIGLILDSVRDTVATMLEHKAHRPEVRIVPAALGESGGAIGAAVMAREADRYGPAVGGGGYRRPSRP
ncbi:MAG: ROK family protein [Acidimicrobiales bacterium]